MKIAAAEAQWNTVRAVLASPLFQIGGFSAQDDRTRASRSSSPAPAVVPGHRLLQRQGRRASTSSRPQEEKQFGPGNYIPRVRLHVLVDAGDGATSAWRCSSIAAVGAWLYRKRRLEQARWFLWTAVIAIAFPFVAATVGWILTEMGRQPWIVQDLLKTSDAHSPSVSTAMVASSIGVFALLYIALGVVDFVLMRRYARLDPPPLREDERGAGAGAELLGAGWTSRPSGSASSPSSGAATSCSRASTSASGCCCRSVPRDEEERDTMFASIGPVWDGNEVWLVVAAGATFAAFPAWYATMFSGFYLALLLILVLLIVRVVSFEWRERCATARAGGRRGGGRTPWAASGAAFVWGVALANLVHGVPLDSDGHFTGDVLDLFSGYTVLAGLSVVALFALHGAVYLTPAHERRAV